MKKALISNAPGRVEAFGFISNGGGGAALLLFVKRLKATFDEVIRFV